MFKTYATHEITNEHIYFVSDSILETFRFVRNIMIHYDCVTLDKNNNPIFWEDLKGLVKEDVN